MQGIAPTYSHGGGAAGGRAAVPGSVTGAGRTIFFGDSVTGKACLTIACLTGSGTIRIETNGGRLDPATGEPPSNEWADVSGGGYSVTAGDILKKGVPVSEPYVRTRITAIAASSNIVSYVSQARGLDGQAVTAGYPPLLSTQSEF